MEKQNTQLTEHSLELQRVCDEENIKSIEDHSREYLKFHSDAVSKARQEEREKVQKEVEKLR